MTLLVIVGMLLYSYGFVELWRLRGRGAGFGVSVLRFGIVASLFSWSVFIVGFGARHSAIYLMQQGLRAGEGTALQAEFAGLAVSSHITMMGLLLAFMVVNPIASILVGLRPCGEVQQPESLYAGRLRANRHRTWWVHQHGTGAVSRQPGRRTASRDQPDLSACWIALPLCRRRGHVPRPQRTRRRGCRGLKSVASLILPSAPGNGNRSLRLHGSRRLDFGAQHGLVQGGVGLGGYGPRAAVSQRRFHYPPPTRQGALVGLA